MVINLLQDMTNEKFKNWQKEKILADRRRNEMRSQSPCIAGRELWETNNSLKRKQMKE